MAGFVRRYTSTPPVEEILQIEGAVIVDQNPPAAIVGAGTGALLTIGEFEDGPFATDVAGVLEVFSPDDKAIKYGSLGYSYGGVTGNNPSARRHLSELWNGNGYLKLYNLRAQRMFIGRVDTSVGSVSFAPLAIIKGGAGPYQLAAGQQVSVTTSTGGPASSTALAAVVAKATGVAGTFPTLFTGGQSIGIGIDGGPSVTVVFSAADQTNTQVVARINSVMGFTAAAVSGGQVEISGITPGTNGRVVLTDTTLGTLATLGLAAGSSSGTGNVGNINAVTAAEIATIINATSALNTINAKAQVAADGSIRFYSSVAGTGTVLVASGVMALALGLSPLGVAVAADGHSGGSIAAGTRVRTAGALEWVTMQTLDIPAASAGPWVAKVRPANDDGTAVGTALNTVTVVVDQPSWTTVAVNNAAALTAALTEVQMDNAYLAAFNASLNEQLPCRDANYLLSARRSDAVIRAGKANAEASFSGGLAARKFCTGDFIANTVAQSIANVAAFRSDRVFYAAKGMKVRVADIAARGTAGGVGFTEDGVITVRPDGPLAMVCCLIPPEDNPGEQTGLIDLFFEVDAGGEVLDISVYKAWKAAGICAPRLDRQSGMVFQSGVTSSLTPGRLNIARRKMADFLEDTFSGFLPPFSKKLNKRVRRDSVRAVVEQFLADLESANAPDQQRIESYAVDDGPNAGNTAERTALGIHYIKAKVRTLSSLDDIVMIVEAGESVVTVTEV